MNSQALDLPLRVLIVDDNKEAAEILSMMVALSGATTMMVFGGAEALATADSFRPHVVLLDLNMPGMSGFDVIKAIRSEPALNRPVVAAVTGWDDEWTIAKTRNQGFDKHITKPARQDDIYDLLLFALARLQTAPSLRKMA